MSREPTKIHKAAIDDRAQIAEFLPPYLTELGDSLDYPYLDLYWSEENRFPYLIKCGAAVAGFAFVRFLDPEGKWEMAEFYIAPQHRRGGVGRAAALQLFRAHYGQWTLNVLPTNITGAKFWRSFGEVEDLRSFTERAATDGERTFTFESVGKS